jgi:hypothetical protein
MSSAWTELIASVGRLAPGCEVKPSIYAQVFNIEMEDPQSMKVEIRPVAFRLKERASDSRAEMFATVKGKVNFSIAGGMNPPLACYFSSEVGYFRLAGMGSNKVDHVLGIHYDYDDRRPAHPVFHAQLTSFHEHLAIINEHYKPEHELRNDLMNGIARKVRLPTAHMDPLAVFVQLLADHLMNENSGSTETAAFEKARTALMFFQSDPDRSKRLALVQENNCFRGPRWYPIPAPQAPPAQSQIVPPATGTA